MLIGGLSKAGAHVTKSHPWGCIGIGWIFWLARSLEAGACHARIPLAFVAVTIEYPLIETRLAQINGLNTANNQSDAN
jgi:hypothetical protein